MPHPIREPAPIKITVHPKLAARMFRLLLLAATGLTLVGVVAQSYTYLPEAGGLRGALSILDPGGDGSVALLSVDAEGSVPAWFSSSLLLVCALLAFSVPARDGGHAARYAGRWRVLAVLLLFMSLDETIALHERTIEPLRWALSAGGPFYYAWVIPGAIFVLGFALSYFGFLLNLPPKQRRLFAIAGTLYVCGALITEMVGGAYTDSYGFSSIAYMAITSVEECLEMVGAATLLYALMVRTEAP